MKNNNYDRYYVLPANVIIHREDYTKSKIMISDKFFNNPYDKTSILERNQNPCNYKYFKFYNEKLAVGFVYALPGISTELDNFCVMALNSHIKDIEFIDLPKEIKSNHNKSLNLFKLSIIDICVDPKNSFRQQSTYEIIEGYCYIILKISFIGNETINIKFICDDEDKNTSDLIEVNMKEILMDKLAKRNNSDSVFTERTVVYNSFAETIEKLHLQDLYKIEKMLGNKESLFGVYFIYDNRNQKSDNDSDANCKIIISITPKSK